MSGNSRLFQLYSFTTSTGSGTGTSLDGLTRWCNADIFLKVTAGTGTVGVFVDSDPDGSGWWNIAQFSALQTAGAGLIHLSKNSATFSNTTLSGDAGAGTVRAAFRDKIRIRHAVISGTLSGEVWVSFSS